VIRKLRKQRKLKKQTKATLGTKIVSDEAHYLYPFYINPISYKDYVEMGFTEGYTEENYKKFKKGALIGATALNTNAKAGCENEFSLFIETDEETYLPNLTQFIDFSKTEDKCNIDLHIDNILDSIKDSVKNIEVYYNDYKLKVNNIPEGAKKFNIFTGKEV
jgi:hypothetical protein